MISVDSALTTTQNPALAAFLGGISSPTGDVAPQTPSATEGISNYSELFADLVGGQENGFILPANHIGIANKTAVDIEALEEVNVTALSPAPGDKPPLDATTDGQIDLSAFTTDSDNDGKEVLTPLFGLSLTSGKAQLNEPGAVSLQKIHSPTPQVEQTETTSILSVERTDNTAGILFPSNARLTPSANDGSSILPIKELEAILSPAAPARERVAAVVAPLVQNTKPGPTPTTANVIVGDTENPISTPIDVTKPVASPADIKTVKTEQAGIEFEISKSQSLAPKARVELKTSPPVSLDAKPSPEALGKQDIEGNPVIAQAAQTAQKPKAQTPQQQATAGALVQHAATTAVSAEAGTTRQPISPKPSDRAEKIKPAGVTEANTQSFTPTGNAPTPANRPIPGVFSPWAGGWTPESISGLSDNANTDLIAGGLSGLKGDGGAFSGVSILGGKASPALTGHVSRQLNLNVTKAVKAGEQEFAMRMDPPELGRVTVKLKFTVDGLVKAHVMAERPETMDMLQREVRGLERAIEAGGSKSAEQGISFSLDDGNQESAGKAFAEALRQEKLQEQSTSQDALSNPEGDPMIDDLTAEVSLEEILAHITPETGVDVRV